MIARLLLEEALKLPPEEREQFCDELKNSLDVDREELSLLELEELRHRIEEHRAKPNDVVSWEDIKKRWQVKYGWSL
jgi:putative addiction module component (TIGR02574 family)